MQIASLDIRDYRQYIGGQCTNGGAYGYITSYYLRPDGRWDVLYSTTAEFSFCEFCGNFCDDSSCACGRTEPDTISGNELLALVLDAAHARESGEEIDVVYYYATSTEEAAR